MGSSEIADCGNFAGGRSNFSMTCSRLSQYLKEKGGFGDLSVGMGLTQKFESLGAGWRATAAGTVKLLPAIMEESGETRLVDGLEEALRKSGLNDAKSEKEAAQMTIFYAGEVMVFDDFPAEKVKEIMSFATKTSAILNYHSAYAPPYTAQSPAESATNYPHVIPRFGIPDLLTHHTPHPPLCSDLPIARKNSLARFLQKRKDRIKENAPYQTVKPAATAAPAEGEAWRGLGAQIQI